MPTISVGEPIGLAFARTGDVLFRPFRFKKWLAIAVVAMLSLAGEGSASTPTGNFSGGRGPGGGGGPDFTEIRDFIHTHVGLIILIGALLILLAYAFYFLICWLNSRAQFMFFDTVVRNSDEIVRPWRDNRSLGNSLFFFRVIWDQICLAITFLILSISLFIAWSDLSHFWSTGNYDFTGSSIGGIIFLICAMLIYIPIAWVLSSVIYDMAVPVMYIRQMRAWQAFKTTWHELFRPNLWKCILYFLFFFVVRMVQGIWAFVGTLLIFLVTCCTAMIVMVIPVIGIYPVALVCLPVLTFERAYKLYFISQFGDAYRINWVITPNAGFPVILDPQPPGPDPNSPSP